MMSTPLRFSRRTVLGGASIAALGTAGAMLSACTPSTGSTGKASNQFTFYSWDTTPDTPLWKVAHQWATSKGLALQLTTIPYDNYDAKMQTVFSSGDVPDLMRINDDFVREYDSKKQLLDLSPYLKKSGIEPANYPAEVFNFPKQPDGSYAAWPIASTPGIVYYNVDAFKAAGLPMPPKDWTSKGWTWDDFLSAAHALTDHAKGTYGVLAFPDTSCETIFPVSNGGPGIYSDDAKTFTLAEPPGYEAMQWLADLALKEKVHPPYSATLAENSDSNWAMDQFSTGKVAMLVGTSGGISYIRDNAKVHWDIAPTPAKVRQTTVNTLIVLAIPKGSKHPDRAWDMMQYATGPQGGGVLAQSIGTLPTQKSVAAKIKVDTKGPANFQLLQQAIDHAVHENFGVYVSRARTIYEPALELVYSGQKTAKDALQGVAKQINAVLRGQSG